MREPGPSRWAGGRVEPVQGADWNVKILVTGAKGFVGRNLCAVLRPRADVELVEFDLGDPASLLEAGARGASVVFHLAGVNRPTDPEEFARGNAGFTETLCRLLEGSGRSAKVVLTSSIQVTRDNPYGRSKLEAEGHLRAWCERTGAEGVVHRLKNLFGKWCRPNYNSVTATFCHNVARGLPLQISDPSNVVELTYVDDVVGAFVAEIGSPARPGFRIAEPLPSRSITLGELATLVQSFRAHRDTLVLPDFSSPFVRALYATYLSYLEPGELGYRLDIKSDARGSLAEFVKSPHFGQIFVSRTKPGITRGNHYHHTKAEKFLVVQGEGIIRLRPIDGDGVVEYRIRGEDYRVVDIAPGFTHSIENVGEGEMVTLFWSSEVFEPARPDTIGAAVTPAPGEGR
jgi:UDP-2-acetamido-2,6-beta-L-arabino-hexul-4-ose reductase